MAAGQARHEHGAARMAFDDEGIILAAAIDHVQDVGAYPTPWPVGTGAAVGMIFPGPYRVTRRDLQPRFGVLEHRRPDRLPRAVGVRVGRPRGRPRHRRPPDRHRPGRAPAPQPARARPTCRTPTPTACPTTTWPRSRRFEQALEILDYDGFRRRAGGGPRCRALPRRRHLLLRRADDGRVRLLRERGRDDPHRAERQGQRLRGGWVHRQQPGDDRGPARGRRARRRHRRTSPRSRATPR